MKFLVIMGSPKVQGNTAALVKPFISRLLEREQATLRTFKTSLRRTLFRKGYAGFRSL